jgi:hypothetical protein
MQNGFGDLFFNPWFESLDLNVNMSDNFLLASHPDADETPAAMLCGRCRGQWPSRQAVLPPIEIVGEEGF